MQVLNIFIVIYKEGWNNLKKGKKVFFIIISTVIILAIAYYAQFMRLEVYTYNEVTETIQKDGVEYVIAKSLPSSFLDKKEKKIGEIKGDKFLESKKWVVKIKGIDEKEMFLVTGVMNEGYI